MSQNSPRLRLEFGSLRFPQALDLLGEVLPVERQVRALGAAQSRRLLLGPAHKVLVVEMAHLGHRHVVSHVTGSDGSQRGSSTSPIANGQRSGKARSESRI